MEEYKLCEYHARLFEKYDRVLDTKVTIVHHSHCQECLTELVRQQFCRLERMVLRGRGL